MKIFDCVTFFEEHRLMKLRLHILYDFIDMPPEGGKTIKFCDICWETFN